MSVCLAVSAYYRESIMPMAWAISTAMVIGIICVLLGIKAGKNMGRKDGYIVVSIAWIVFSLVGMIPYLVDRCITDVPGAFLETISGFTSTGATVINDIDSTPKGVLFWRSMTQWIGGIGIIFFTIAILPAFGVGEVKLFAAESTGPLHDKVHPRISVAVKWIGTVYVLLTTLCFISLAVCGMGLYDAVSLSMTITGTGGFSPHSALLHDVYNSPAIEYVITFFMFVSGVNYTLIYYAILKGRLRKFFSDAEVRTYMLIVLCATVACTMTLFLTNSDRGLELSFRESIFTVISLQTTTGLATCDYTVWPVHLMPVLLFVMFVGACSGSTSGGFKCIRLKILYSVLRNEVMRILHPRAVVPVKVNDNVISNSIVKTLLAFSTLFVGALFLGTFVIALSGIAPESGHDFRYNEAFGLSMASLSNVGPGMGYFGPLHSWDILNPVSKIICSILMLIGRLEIFPLFIVLTKTFWRKG